MNKENKARYLELVKGITRECNYKSVNWIEKSDLLEVKVDYEEKFRTGGQTKMNI